jgi:signal transduction histidine kinase
MFMGPPVHAKIFGGMIAVVTRRIDGPHGEFAGVAAAILNMSYLEQVLKRYESLAGVRASLYLRDGTTLARYPDGKGRIGRAGAHTRLFREELPRAEAGTYHAASAETGERRIFSYKAVAGYPLVAQVSMARAAALAPWHGRIGVTGGLALLAMAAAALATAMIYRQARRLEAERLRALEAQFAAEDASRSKSEFLAHMSHELRTPMNAVIGFTEMMSREVYGPIGSAKYREYLGDIAVSGQHLLHVVNNVLDLAKVEAGKWEIEEAPIALREFCISSAQMVRERARASHVGVDVDADAPTVTLAADPRLLRQIVLNLVTNAIKFTEPGGRVSIGWGLRADGSLALEVRDTGVGMSSEDTQRVLQPFGRGSALRARARHEPGLGLPLCKRFAELHGGELAITSVLGAGTCVTVVFPEERVLTRPAPPDAGVSVAAA